MIKILVRNGDMLELSSVVLIEVNVTSLKDQYLLVLAQRHHLNKGQMWQIIRRIKGDETQMQVAHDFNIS